MQNNYIYFWLENSSVATLIQSKIDKVLCISVLNEMASIYVLRRRIETIIHNAKCFMCSILVVILKSETIV